MNQDDRSSPWALVTVAASLVFLVAGIVWPGVAESLLRFLLTGLALGWGASRALGTGLPTETLSRTYSPFDSAFGDLPPPSVPDVVRRRARQLTSADDPEGGGQQPIPWTVAQDLIHEAARRLENGHGLGLGRPADAGRIRALVSGATWTLLGMDDPGDATDVYESAYRMIPLALLDAIIDDLERL